jgi:NitT/TauT family transport system substrate-binding protein
MLISKLTVRSFLFCLLLLSSLSRAETINLAVPGPGSLVYLPVQLAVAVEADKAEGLDLKLRFFSGGPLALRDLSEHNSDFTVAGLPAIASARADKMPVLAIGQLSQAAMVSLILRKDLKGKVHNIAQLKGRRIGVNTSTRTARSTSQMLAEYLLNNAGLNADDVQIIPAGQTREAQRSALIGETVDAVMGDEPFATELASKNEASILLDLYNPQRSRELLGGPFVHAALATREDVFKEHRLVAVKVQHMFDKTLQWMNSHSAQEILDKLANQPGFDPQRNQILLSVLQRNPKMYPVQCAWDPKAILTTERFFHGMAADQAESSLHFSEFVRNASPEVRP